MPDHYYTQMPSSAHRPELISVQALGTTLQFHTDAGVFSRMELDFGTRLLLESLPDLSGRVLDLGCGWGAIGTFLAKQCPEARIVMADINQRAVDLALANAKQNRIDNVDVIQSDGFQSIVGQFDAIVTNPPIRAGKQLIYSLFDQAKTRLNKGGALFVVIRKQQGAPSALTHLEQVYGKAEVICRDKGFWIIKAEVGDAL